MSESYNDIIGSAVTISGGEQYGAPGYGFIISSGAANEKGILSVGYMDGDTVHGGGTVYSATIMQGGTLNIISGPSPELHDITLDGGVLWADRYYGPSSATQGGAFTISGLTVHGGLLSTWKATAKSYYQDGGSARFWSGGVSSGAINGGKIDIMGGSVIFNNMTVSGGTVVVSSGKIANDVIYDGFVSMSAGNGDVSATNLVLSGGTLDVRNAKDVLANCTFVGGTVKLSAGKLSGTTTIGGDVEISTIPASLTDTNAGYVFDLSERDASAAAIINDFSFSNAASYSVSVTGTQTGSYALAGNAANMADKSFNFTVGGETITGGITVGGASVEVGDNLYTLALVEDVLTLAVDSSTPPGELVITAGSYNGKYDGEPHTVSYTTKGTMIQAEDQLLVTIDGTITDPGIKASTITSCVVMRGTENVTAEYSITTIDGVLRVYGYDDIISSSVNLAAPNTYGDAGGFIIGEGGTFNNGYVESGAIYTAGVVTSATLSSGGRINVVNTVSGATIFHDLTIDGGTLSAARKPDGTNDGAVFCIDGLTVISGAVSYAWRCDIRDLLLLGGVVSTHSGTMSGGTIHGGTLTGNGNFCNNQNVYMDGGAIVGGATYSAINLNMVGGVLRLTGNANALSSSVIAGGSALLGGNYYSAGASKFFRNDYLDNTILGGTVTARGGHFTNLSISGGLLEFITSDNSTPATAGSGAYLSGAIELAGTAQVSVAAYTSGAEINYGWIDDSKANYVFDLDGRTEADVAFISDFGFTDAASYTISVEVDQASGTYQIASGAASLDGETFQLVVGSANPIDITVNGPSVHGLGGNYTLTEVDGNVAITVEAITLSPVTLLLNGHVVSGAESFSNVTLDGTTFDQMVISGGTATSTTVNDGTNIQMLSGALLDTVLYGGAIDAGEGYVSGVVVSGGTVELMTDGIMSNVQIRSGAAANVDGDVDGLTTVSGAVAVISSGSVVSNVDIRTYATGGFVISAGATVDGGTIRNGGNASSVQVGGILRNVTVSNGSTNCFVVNGGGIAENVTFYAGARISGTVSNADIYTGLVRIFNNGKAQGTINVYGGTIDMTYSNSKIDGTVNLIGEGTFVLTSHQNASLNTEITVNGAVNLAEGTYIGESNGAVTNLTINGAINVNGGQVKNGALVAGKAWMFGTTGSLNFNLEGLTAAETAYVASYNSLNKAAAAETGTAFTITANVGDTIGSYVLFGDASEFSTRSQTITINGVEASLGYTYTDAVACRGYALTYDTNSESVILSVAAVGGAVASTTGAITGVTSGVAAATWDASTTYEAGRIYAGNIEAANTVLFIDNEGAIGAGATYAFGGADGVNLGGEADIRLYQGNIGAIMGGAQDANLEVGAVDVQIGGGTVSATTGVVYGAGFGSVKGDVTITTSKGAVVTGQLYGGPMVLSGYGATVSGAIALELNGGELKSDVIGGARVQADPMTSTTVGAINVNIDGAAIADGVDNCVYGAGWVVGKGTEPRMMGSDYTAASVTINVNSDVAIGTASGRGIFGGALAAQYAIAEVSGNVEINVTGCEVAGNVYGGGWAQKGAVSNVTGNVTINVTDATVGSIYGGGAHSNAVEIAGTTSVGGSVEITIDNSTVGLVCAVGQAQGDAIEGDATITVSGASVIDNLSGVGYLDAGKDVNATLVLEDFTGSVNNNVRSFAMVTVTGDTTATFANVDECFGWEIYLDERTSTDAAFTWENGSFAVEKAGDATFNLYLNSADATAWTVADLSGDDSKDGAFDNVTFNLYDGNAVAIKTGYVLGSEIADTSTAWDGWKLDYQDGKLAFAQLA